MERSMRYPQKKRDILTEKHESGTALEKRDSRPKAVMLTPMKVVNVMLSFFCDNFKSGITYIATISYFAPILVVASTNGYIVDSVCYNENLYNTTVTCNYLLG